MTAVETFNLAKGHRISRVIKGGWQLAGDHGPVDAARAIAAMDAFVEAGITAFDCADIYTGVEEMIGAFLADRVRRGRPIEAIRIHTKYVPDIDTLATVGLTDVRAIITRSLQRLGVDQLDLVQFHWWDLGVPRWVEVAGYLAELQREGLIRTLGATNFGTDASAAMLDAGIRLASMQVQYSLLDRRPERRLVALGGATGMHLLCYGSLAGGLLTDRWLGQAEPDEFHNRSHLKYKLVIDDAGGWDWFQALLRVLKTIATKHGVSVANVATRWVLDRPQVAAAIVGARHEDHIADTLGVFRVTLDEMDRMGIDAVLAEGRQIDGDVYAAERDRTGRHGRIMKYRLNADPNAVVG